MRSRTRGFAGAAQRFRLDRIALFPMRLYVLWRMGIWLPQRTSVRQRGTLDMNDENRPVLKVTCSTGSIDARVGDRFKDDHAEWEIIGFEPRYDEMTVLCKPVTGSLPSHWRPWERADHTVAWCDDSVAAALLTMVDGKPRSSRGSLLTLTNRAATKAS